MILDLSGEEKLPADCSRVNASQRRKATKSPLHTMHFWWRQMPKFLQGSLSPGPPCAWGFPLPPGFADVALSVCHWGHAGQSRAVEKLRQTRSPRRGTIAALKLLIGA